MSGQLRYDWNMGFCESVNNNPNTAILPMLKALCHLIQHEKKSSIKKAKVG
jgi:hypothetical protein